MDALGVGPEECLVVEDSSTGIAAGVASGATVVAVERYASATMDQSAADVRIPCLRDILDVTGVRS
jgi:beta-phosphoglucomutase-like phosphatase (HAD superfamily)